MITTSPISWSKAQLERFEDYLDDLSLAQNHECLPEHLKSKYLKQLIKLSAIIYGVIIVSLTTLALYVLRIPFAELIPSPSTVVLILLMLLGWWTARKQR